jgi:ribosomal protein S18 acetylase RimI-like enzyme
MTAVVRGDARHVDDAAQVWAEATAARDGQTAVAPLESSRPVIADVFAQPGAVLVVALDDGQVTAFAVAAPSPVGQLGAIASRAEVRYAGVRPDRWGRGLAGRVLRLLCTDLTAGGFAEVDLLVYVDNGRAAAVYQHWAGNRPGPRCRTRGPGSPNSATG